MPVPNEMCRFGRRERSSSVARSCAPGSRLAAAIIAMILSPLRRRTPSSSTSCRTKRGLENCTGETKRRNSSTARPARLQSAASQVAPCRILEHLVHRAADQVRGGLGAGAQQQEDHRHHLAGADAPALLLDPHQLGDQSLAAVQAREPQALLEIAAHPHQSADHAQEAERVGEMSRRVRPGDELRPVLGRQAEQLADHRERQHARIAFDQIGRGCPPRTARRRARPRWHERAAPCRAPRGGEKPRPRWRAGACGPARPSSACCSRRSRRIWASTSAGRRARRPAAA